MQTWVRRSRARWYSRKFQFLPVSFCNFYTRGCQICVISPQTRFNRCRISRRRFQQWMPSQTLCNSVQLIFNSLLLFRTLMLSAILIHIPTLNILPLHVNHLPRNLRGPETARSLAGLTANYFWLPAKKVNIQAWYASHKQCVQYFTRAAFLNEQD